MLLSSGIGNVTAGGCLARQPPAGLPDMPFKPFVLFGFELSLRQTRLLFLLAFFGGILFPSSHLMGNQCIPGLQIFKGFAFAAFSLNVIVKYGSIFASLLAVFFVGAASAENLKMVAKFFCILSFIGISTCLVCMQTFKVPSKSAQPINVGEFIDRDNFGMVFQGDSSRDPFLHNVQTILSLSGVYNESVSIPFSADEKPESARVFARALWALRFIFQDLLYFSFFVFVQWTACFYLISSQSGKDHPSSGDSNPVSASPC